MSRYRAFGFLCELLSLDESPVVRSGLLRTAQSGKVPWDVFVAHASRHWVSAAVSHALHTKGIKDDLPGDVVDYFEGVATLNRQRNNKIFSEAVDLARILNGVGITPIFLKGSANLIARLYPDSAQRIMLDIDVLIPGGQLTDGVAALRANGYDKLLDIDFPHHHYPPLGRPDRTAAVELHVDPLDIRARKFLSGAEIVEGATGLAIEGTRFAIPSTWCRLVHCIAHTQYSDHAYIRGDLSLRELLDTALLSRSETIDWKAISARFDARAGKTGLAFHMLAARLLGGQGLEVSASRGRAYSFFRRARFQADFPRLQSWSEMLLRPWLLFMRSFSHPLLRRRLLRSLFDRNWYARQWRTLRTLRD